MPNTIAVASSFGHVAFQSRRPRLARGATGRSRVTSPADSSVSSSSRTGMSRTGMTAHLRTQLVGDRAREVGDLTGVESARPLHVDGKLLDHASGPARQQDDPIAEADGLADVVGDEQHGEPRLAP